jgi:hypothetical protein
MSAEVVCKRDRSPGVRPVSNVSWSSSAVPVIESTGFELLLNPLLELVSGVVRVTRKTPQRRHSCVLHNNNNQSL